MDQPMMTIESFQRHFSTEEACAEVLFHAKWPTGFSCTRCGHRHASTIVTRRLPLFECRHCGYQSSLTAGTVMEGSRTELRKWFMAFFLFSRAECGTSAVELSRSINVTYKTAWLILRKIRHAISEADGRSLLAGIVKVDGSVYGRPHNPSWYRHPQEHPLLIGASVDEQGKPTYVKMKLVSDTHMKERVILRSAEHAFSRRHIEPQMTNAQFVTKPVGLQAFPRPASHLCSGQSLDQYDFSRTRAQASAGLLDEFCYRLNLSPTHPHLQPSHPFMCRCRNHYILSVNKTYKKHCLRQLDLTFIWLCQQCHETKISNFTYLLAYLKLHF